MELLMKNLDELSFSTRWKAGIERAKRGPSKKAVPTMFRTTGKKAKNLQKKVSTGPSADYSKYSDRVKKQGRIPMSFSNWIKSHG
jgi:hypothetical protein